MMNPIATSVTQLCYTSRCRTGGKRAGIGARLVESWDSFESHPCCGVFKLVIIFGPGVYCE